MNETEYRNIDQKRTLSLGDRPYQVGRFIDFFPFVLYLLYETDKDVTLQKTFTLSGIFE